jgi:hypothetical protein
MLHLVAQPEPEMPVAYAEAVARLASVRHALRLVDGGFGEGPEPDIEDRVASVWPEAGQAKQRWFDRRSAQLVATAAAGIEALLDQRQMQCEPHRAASHALTEEIRRELREVAAIVLA